MSVEHKHILINARVNNPMDSYQEAIDFLAQNNLIKDKINEPIYGKLNNKTLLDLAIEEKEIDVAKKLIEYGAEDLRIETKNLEESLKKAMDIKSELIPEVKKIETKESQIEKIISKEIDLVKSLGSSIKNIDDSNLVNNRRYGGIIESDSKKRSKSIS